MCIFKEIIEILKQEFSEVEKIYDNNIEDFEDLPYVLYESVFVKYILEEIRRNDKKKLKKIFDFIERLLREGDDDVKILIDVAIVESLYFEKHHHTIEYIIDAYGGDLTKKSFESCNTNDE